MKLIRTKNFPFIPASHEDKNNPGVLKKVLCIKEDLQPGQVQMINWAVLPKGSSFRQHYHEDMEEVFIMVHGEAEIEVDNEKTLLEPQDTVLVPPRAVHSMTNVGDCDVEYIVVGISNGRGGKTVVVS